MRIGDFSPVFGKNVRYLRSLSHMSRETLGALVGTSKRYIRKIESAKGLVGMDYRIFGRICAVFDVAEGDIRSVDLEARRFVLPVHTDPHWEPVEEY